MNLKRERKMQKRKRRRRVRWGRVISVLLVFAFIGVGIYAIMEYYQGTRIAKAGNFSDDNKNAKSFQGEEVKFGKINVLLLGSDSRGEKHARTDSIMIAHYDQNTHEPKLISIMRDSFVDIPGYGRQKINAAYAIGGTELLRKTIKENFGIDINYYAVVDFKGFEKVVDVIAPKGIEVDVPSKMSYGIGMTLQPGKQVLHGDKLLGYVRFRHDNLSDFGRVQRQQEVIEKLKDQAMSMTSLLKLPKILGVINPYLDTDLDTPTLFTLGKDLLTNKSSKVQTLRIPVNGSYTNETYDNVGAVLNIDLAQNKHALDEFLSSNS
ncbi:transcriptional regulator [Heyndrickxia camelliae]|uniref:Regulatory protein MsrR n=2 Tax=Heyndrickxia camelliae TaxID=1707093 RepID=A0A2N3LKJ1_9BACI|nr:transcriptional regulator [Heyndrickxia camelliae]